MFTSLDLLVIASMVLVAMAVLSLGLMFLIRNKTAKRVFFYIACALGLYTAWIGFQIGFGGYFLSQIALSVVTVLLVAGAFILERRSRGNEKLFLIAQCISAGAFLFGFANALLF